MICKNCGNRMADGMVFCDRCGTRLEKETAEIKNCDNCETLIEPGMTECPVCGRAVADMKAIEKSVYKEPRFSAGNGQPASGGVRINTGTGAAPTPPPYTPPTPPYSGGDGPVDNSRRNVAVVLIIIIAAILIIGIIAASTGKAQSQNNQSAQTDVVYTPSPSPSETIKPKATSTPKPSPTVKPTPTPTVKPSPTPTATPTPSPTVKPTPSPTAKPAVSKAIKSPDYMTYYDEEYDFTLDYPSHFSEFYEKDDKFAESLKYSADGAVMRIYAKKNADHQSPTDIQNDFKLENYGRVTYENKGSNWCVVSINGGGKYHYGYYKVLPDKIMGFEYHYDENEEPEYSKYIEHIYDSFEYWDDDYGWVKVSDKK